MRLHKIAKLNTLNEVKALKMTAMKWRLRNVSEPYRQIDEQIWTKGYWWPQGQYLNGADKDKRTAQREKGRVRKLPAGSRHPTVSILGVQDQQICKSAIRWYCSTLPCSPRGITEMHLERAKRG